MSAVEAGQPLGGVSVLRPEIQALRTLAVAAVVLYHAWPNRLPGGFIGVDVFFVVSGFLITSHLLREVWSSGAIRLSRFWARRARRLLPASLLVLVVTAVGVLLIAPAAQWAPFFREIAASALYVQNWALIAASVDYLAAENAPSPVQHYWSLGVEEQLYVVWPLLIVLAVIVSLRLRRSPRLATGIVVGAVFIISLTASSWAVATGQSDAYFATYYRAWEFAAGGAIAFLPQKLGRLSDSARAALAWVGWTTLVAICVLYSGETDFPGYGALPVVVATVAIIVAGAPSATWGPSQLASLRPVQWIGDLSYSIYLWHWPLLILTPYLLGSPLNAVQKIALIAITVTLSWVTVEWVEKPFRFRPWSATARPSRVLAVGLATSALLAAAAFSVVLAADQRSRDDLAQVDEQQETLRECFGAGALVFDDCAGSSPSDYVPSVESAGDDRSAVYDPSCRTSLDSNEVKDCVFGPDDGKRVLLVGDSHAALWFPALEPLAEREGWRLQVYFRGGCSYGLGVRAGDEPSDGQLACQEWAEGVAQAIEDSEPHELVFTAATTTGRGWANGDGEVTMEAGINAYLEAWMPILSGGSQLIVMAEAPLAGTAVIECQQANPADPRVCDRARADATDHVDLAAEAALQSGVPVIDMTDYFCTEETCPTVVGGVLVYRDRHHFTGTYGQSLAPFLEQELAALGVIE